MRSKPIQQMNEEQVPQPMFIYVCMERRLSQRRNHCVLNEIEMANSREEKWISSQWR